jgi:hypothetical protein
MTTNQWHPVLILLLISGCGYYIVKQFVIIVLKGENTIAAYLKTMALGFLFFITLLLWILFMMAILRSIIVGDCGCLASGTWASHIIGRFFH